VCQAADKRSDSYCPDVTLNSQNVR